jgi:hypothetical protein
MLDEPGPPLSHIVSGAVSGLVRDSMNQKKVSIE